MFNDLLLIPVVFHFLFCEGKGTKISPFIMHAFDICFRKISVQIINIQ